METKSNELTSVCNSLTKTYNAFWLDKFDTQLKEACWNEATSPNGVLTKLISNHREKKSTQNIEGPFTVYWNSEYKKKVYIFEEGISIGTTNIINQNFINILLADPIAFIDLYLKESIIDKNELKKVITEPIKEPIKEEHKLSEIHFTNNFVKPDNPLFRFLNEIMEKFSLKDPEISDIVIQKFCADHKSILEIFIEKDDSEFEKFWKTQIITDVLLNGVIEKLKPEISKFFESKIVQNMLKFRSNFFHIGKTIKYPEQSSKTYSDIKCMLIAAALQINQIISDFYIMSDIFKIFESGTDRPTQAYNIIIYLPDSLDVPKYQKFLETFGFIEIKN